MKEEKCIVRLLGLFFFIDLFEVYLIFRLKTNDQFPLYCEKQLWVFPFKTKTVLGDERLKKVNRFHFIEFTNLFVGGILDVILKIIIFISRIALNKRIISRSFLIKNYFNKIYSNT